MVWFRRETKDEAPEATVEFTHTSGAVRLRDVEARIDDERLELRGLLDQATWERLQRDDIFGATSRTRSPGTLPSGDELRITVTTDRELPSEAVPLPSDWFVIVDAMRQVDVEELRAAGLEGEIWEGIHFSDPHLWSAAVAELVADGFEVITTDEQSTLLQHEDDYAVVQFRRREDVRLVQIVVSTPLGVEGDLPVALYEAINGINVVVPWSTTMIDDGDVMVRETVADEVVDQAALIATRVQEMLGLMFVMRGPLADVAQGALTPQASLEAMFN